MALFYKKLFEPVVLTTAAVTVFTVPPAQIARGLVVRFVNTTAGIENVTAYAVPNGDALGADNLVVLEKAIAPNDFYDLVIPTLAAGDYLQLLASANTSITAHFLQGVLQG